MGARIYNRNDAVHRYGRSRWGNVINFLILILIALFMSFPLVFIANNAFKPVDEIYRFPPNFFVRNPTLLNFKSMMRIMRESWVPFSRYFFNTIFITMVSVTGLLIISSFSAMILEKRRFPGRELISKIIVYSLMFSPVVLQVPQYLIMSWLHMIDTYAALIIPSMATPLGLFLMKQFMSVVPDTLLEAAKIDGAGELRTFAWVVFPIMRPAALTLIVLSFQTLWAMTGGTLITSEAKKPLNFALSQIISAGVSRQGAAAAVSLFMIIPPIAVFLMAQKNIIETMAYSGIKE